MVWTAPRTWVAGEVPAASVFNTHVRDNLKAIGDAWTAWTPTITAASGTFTTTSASGRYINVGKLVIYSATITITTQGTANGDVRFTLPVSALAADNFIGAGREITATGVLLSVTAGSGGTFGNVMRYDNATIIASGRTLKIQGTYEAA